MRKSISAYAKAAGLFRDLHVRHLGARKKESDPFQIEITIPGQQGKRNIVDVGYGVSQVLPVLVDGVTLAGARMLLLQQPEVHLHPRAQAELGSFFARAVQQSGLSAVVETHSDFLLDRIRLAVRNGDLDSDKVSLLFFDREGTGGPGVSIHQMRIDDGGNVVDAPANYRNFFLREELSLLGVDAEDLDVSHR